MNRRQKDGLASLFDILAAAGFVALTANIMGYGDVKGLDLVLLSTISPWLVLLAYFLRGDD